MRRERLSACHGAVTVCAVSQYGNNAARLKPPDRRGVTSGAAPERAGGSHSAPDLTVIAEARWRLIVSSSQGHGRHRAWAWCTVLKKLPTSLLSKPRARTQIGPAVCLRTMGDLLYVGTLRDRVRALMCLRDTQRTGDSRIPLQSENQLGDHATDIASVKRRTMRCQQAS